MLLLTGSPPGWLALESSLSHTLTTSHFSLEPAVPSKVTKVDACWQWGKGTYSKPHLRVNSRNVGSVWPHLPISQEELEI